MTKVSDVSNALCKTLKSDFELKKSLSKLRKCVQNYRNHKKIYEKLHANTTACTYM